MARDRSKVLPFREKGIALNASSASNSQEDGTAGTPPKPLAEPDLRLVVMRSVLYGTFHETFHSEHDRAYRNVTDDDIDAMLTGDWKLAGKPEWDDKHSNWKYRLVGHDIDGDELTLIVAVNAGLEDIRIITKF